MTTFCWLHLSDLHLKETTASPDRARFDRMLGSIAETRRREKLNPDAIFITGDLAFSGQPKQYDEAEKYLEKVLDVCDLAAHRDRLLIVPGNHDVDRSRITEARHEVIAKALLDQDRYTEIEDFFRSDLERQMIFAKFANFARFVESFVSGTPMSFGPDRFHYVMPIEKEGQKVVVVGLNSAWLSNRNNEQGRLLLGEAQVCDALEEVYQMWPDARLRIALVHHPLYWLAEKDVHRTQQHLARKCDLLLRGHLHCPSFSVRISPDSQLREFAAGASLKAPYQAYNLIQVDLDTGEGVAFVMLQHPDLGTEWGSDSFTYGNIPDGKVAFSIRRASATSL